MNRIPPASGWLRPRVCSVTFSILGKAQSKGSSPRCFAHFPATSIPAAFPNCRRLPCRTRTICGPDTGVARPFSTKHRMRSIRPYRLPTRLKMNYRPCASGSTICGPVRNKSTPPESRTRSSQRRNPASLGLLSPARNTIPATRFTPYQPTQAACRQRPLWRGILIYRKTKTQVLTVAMLCWGHKCSGVFTEACSPPRRPWSVDSVGTLHPSLVVHDHRRSVSGMRT